MRKSSLNGAGGSALFARIKQWRGGRNRRSAPRFSIPALFAYYWDGGVARAHEVLNISETGAYFNAPLCYPGTIIELTLQTNPHGTNGAGPTPGVLRVPARVVRFDPGGLGVQFVYAYPSQRKEMQTFLGAVRAEGIRVRKASKGQALIEFALTVPLLFVLLANLVNFGAFLFGWITVANAARSGAQYAVMAGASVGGPAPPSAAQVNAVITQDISSLLNRASLKYRVCTNYNGTSTCTGSAGYAPPAAAGDPEAAHYVAGTVDVSYTYQAPIPVFDFVGLGIRATLPSATIHRRAVMRMIQ